MENFKEYLKNCLEIPEILLKILNRVGYDNFIALKGINAETVVDI